MSKMFSDFNGLELFFLGCAVIGAVSLVFKVVLMLMGADTDGDADVGVDADVDFDSDGDFDADAGHVDSDMGFHLLSLLGISTFFMMFGLVGLTCFRQYHLNGLISSAGAVAGGAISMWIVGKVFKYAMKLQSSGTLRTADAVGCSGTVYLNIPAGGSGRVTLNFNNHLREFDAASKDGAALPTGTSVRVVEVRADVLIVEKSK